MKNIKSILQIAAAKVGIQICRSSDASQVEAILTQLTTPTADAEKQLIGQGGDGSYYIPKDLRRITRCFSPGVDQEVSFDLGIADLGIPVSMIDRSVLGPPVEHELFSFRPYFLASYTSARKGFISFEDWVEMEDAKHAPGQWILQMDIEGAEWSVIHSLSSESMKRLDIIIIEFHHLHQLLNCNWLSLMKIALMKIFENHEVLHSEGNKAGGFYEFNGQRRFSLLEVTFIRK